MTSIESGPIDFDASSVAWRANKRQQSMGHFLYDCTAITKKGKRCTLAAVSEISFDHTPLCKVHTRLWKAAVG